MKYEDYLAVEYLATNAPRKDIKKMTKQAETTFDRWCAVIGAIPLKVKPAAVVKMDKPTPPKPQNPEDDEIQF